MIRTVHLTPSLLLVVGAAGVGVVHAVLPDHWVPLAVVARAERWSRPRLVMVTAIAASGHILASILLGGVVALIGLQFQRQIETQQGHVVGGILILTGLGFLLWSYSGHGHPHAHDRPAESHEHSHTDVEASARVHEHEHAHGDERHSHRHRHEVFVRRRSADIATRGLAAVVVPFGVAASPDLSFLPLAVGSAAYGPGAVVGVVGAFAASTFAVFVGLTLAATVLGYQVRGEWLEDHAQTITALILIVIGAIAFFGL